MYVNIVLYRQILSVIECIYYYMYIICIYYYMYNNVHVKDICKDIVLYTHITCIITHAHNIIQLKLYLSIFVFILI